MINKISTIFDLFRTFIVKKKDRRKEWKHQFHVFLIWNSGGQQVIFMGHWQHLCIDTEK